MASPARLGILALAAAALAGLGGVSSCQPSSPASYANFYLANGVALVPVFGAPSDARALAVLRELLPGRQVTGIPSADLVFGLGAMHCMTQQEPV